jgi:hypothetical protein
MSPVAQVSLKDDTPISLRSGIMIEPTTHTLDAPGAVLSHDVRSNHGGSLGGGYGQTGDRDAFAATLRRVLAAEA